MAEVKLPDNNQPPVMTRERKLETIVSGPVKTRKKPLSQKFVETFLTDDVGSVRSYLIFDVIIPSIKETISECVSKGIDMLLFGETKSTNKKTGPYVSYGSFSQQNTKKERRSSVERQRTNVSDYQNIVFESRGDAEAVLDQLCDYLERFHIVSVAELYDLINVTGQFTDKDWGWTNLSTAKVERTRNGYILVLPKLTYLE